MVSTKHPSKETKENQDYHEKLKEYTKSEAVKKCSHCSMCREVCPTYMVSRKESSYAGGKMRALRTYSAENYSIDEDFVKTMAYCTTCKQCEQMCPISFDYIDTIETLRKYIVSKTNHPYGNQINFAKNVLIYKNPYGEDTLKRTTWLNEKISMVDKGPYGYFVGCTSSYRDIDSAVDCAIILSRILKDGIVLLGPEEYCCGSPLIRTGQVNFDLNLEDQKKFDLRELIKHNVDSIASKGVKSVIFNCSGCYKTATQDWPQYYGKKIPFEMVHFTQFIAKKIENNEIRLKFWNKKITYHDPCHLGRHSLIYDEPRRILKAIPGIELIEMKHNRETTLCCGAGGGVKASFPVEALEIAKMRVKEALETKAEILATSCVFCKINLQNAANFLKVDIKIMNLENLLENLFYF